MRNRDKHRLGKSLIAILLCVYCCKPMVISTFGSFFSVRGLRLMLHCNVMVTQEGYCEGQTRLEDISWLIKCG